MAVNGVRAAPGPAYQARLTTPANRLAVAGGAPRIARASAAAGLLALMALGSVAMWTAIPLGVLWLASQLTDSFPQLALAPCVTVIVGIPLAMALCCKALRALQRVYERVPGTTTSARLVPAWRRSISDSRSRTPATPLEKMMIGSVLAAAITLVAWFFLIAGPSLPA